MKFHQRAIKRFFDLFLSLVLFPILILPILVLVIIASIDTSANGFFMHERIGQYGKPFKMFKIRTLKVEEHQLGRLTESATGFGNWLRRTKLDELPQIFNVILGQMSFVGPRPDVRGFADELRGENREILKIKPGVTGPATLKYKDEDYVLALQEDAENYNRTIIWPDKVRINLNYVRNWSFISDICYLLKSIKG